ncbi:Gfo/Idh/MocA family protein [Alkalihalobacillus sp. 1P02AB]|uniref:Gfo/Idh/MocA family protein n=1 Tax=Alkalihalobacillus sp. 1P02AB TaxID=3132260 RepID=UPI0039A53F03
MGVRYGIIGTGRMGLHHVNQLKQIEGASIIAVCDEIEQNTDELVRLTGAIAYTDYKEMIEKEKLDAIYLCTPVKDRVQQVKIIAEKKINLYIEKPLASSVEEGEEIARIVNEAGIICSVGFQWKHMDIVKMAKEIVGDEPITLITGRWYWTVPLRKWLHYRHMGGGQVFDQSIHLINLSSYFSGEFDHLYAAFTQKVTIGEIENWDGYSITAKFKNHTVANFYSTYGLYQELEEEPFLDIIQKNRLLRIHITRGKLMVKTPGKEEMFYSQDKVQNIDKNFHEAVQSGNKGKILTTVEDGLHTLKVVLAASYSAKNEMIVKLDEFNHFGLHDLYETNEMTS